MHKRIELKNMKWCFVISFAFICCTSGIAQNETTGTSSANSQVKTSEPEDQLTVVSLPQPVPAVNTSDASRIIGGSATTIERFPYIVQVQINNRLACGGSLLTRRHVLTAAHCFFDTNGILISPSRYSIRAGTARLETGGSVHSVSTVVIHERYNTPVRDNDIAIMVLSSRVTLSTSIAVASILGQFVEVPDNSSVIHIGWGRTNVNVNVPASVLQEVTIRTVPFNICYERYQWLSSLHGEQYLVTSNMICSGLLDIGGADACQGDSGGPLIYQGIVVGVTSWGYGCAEAYFPGVNAKVSAYTNWINHTVTMYGSGPLSSTSSLLLISASILAAIFVR